MAAEGISRVVIRGEGVGNYLVSWYSHRLVIVYGFERIWNSARLKLFDSPEYGAVPKSSFARMKVPNAPSMISAKLCRLIQTAGRWPQKSESAKWTRCNNSPADRLRKIGTVLLRVSWCSQMLSNLILNEHTTSLSYTLRPMHVSVRYWDSLLLVLSWSLRSASYWCLCLVHWLKWMGLSRGFGKNIIDMNKEFCWPNKNFKW